MKNPIYQQGLHENQSVAKLTPAKISINEGLPRVHDELKRHLVIITWPGKLGVHVPSKLSKVDLLGVRACPLGGLCLASI